MRTIPYGRRCFMVSQAATEKSCPLPCRKSAMWAVSLIGHGTVLGAGWNGAPASCLGAPMKASGYIDTGVIPKFAGCVLGSQWFMDRGQWQDGSFEPSAGHIIFFDWEGDGVTDHVGIVERVENGTVYTVEGNSSDSVRQNSYPIGSSVIYGYGIPAY